MFWILNSLTLMCFLPTQWVMAVLSQERKPLLCLLYWAKVLTNIGSITQMHQHSSVKPSEERTCAHASLCLSGIWKHGRLFFFFLFFFFCTIMCICWAEGKPATVKSARRREMWHQARLALTDRNSPVTHLLTNALIHTQRTQNRRKILQSQSRRMTSKLEKVGDSFPGTCARKLFACVSVISTQFHH